MRRYFGFWGLVLLLVPATGFAASREQQEMQRDIEQLQDQVRTLDQKVATLQALLQQAIELGNKTNAGIDALGTSVGEKIDSASKAELVPFATLTAKVDNVQNNEATLINSIGSLQEQVNRQQQLLTDLKNAIKVLQTPPAAPPANGADGLPASAAPPPASSLWDNARVDFSTGRLDMAADDYTQFLRYYPDDPNAAEAQFQLGRIHSAQTKYDQAVMDFDAVLAQYPDSKYAPAASFEKGMALKTSGNRDAAMTEFRALIKKYPSSPQARDAQEQLRALNPRRPTRK